MLRVRNRPDPAHWMKLEPVGELRPLDGLKKALEMSYEPIDEFGALEEKTDFQRLLDRLR
jgi:hypothetical protein